MIKEFIIRLEGLYEDVTVTWSEHEQDYVIRTCEPLTWAQLNAVLDEVKRALLYLQDT